MCAKFSGLERIRRRRIWSIRLRLLVKRKSQPISALVANRKIGENKVSGRRRSVKVSHSRDRYTGQYRLGGGRRHPPCLGDRAGVLQGCKKKEIGVVRKRPVDKRSAISLCCFGTNKHTHPAFVYQCPGEASAPPPAGDQQDDDRHVLSRRVSFAKVDLGRKGRTFCALTAGSCTLGLLEHFELIIERLAVFKHTREGGDRLGDLVDIVCPRHDIYLGGRAIIFKTGGHGELTKFRTGSESRTLFSFNGLGGGCDGGGSQRGEGNG